MELLNKMSNGKDKDDKLVLERLISSQIGITEYENHFSESQGLRLHQERNLLAINSILTKESGASPPKYLAGDEQGTNRTGGAEEEICIEDIAFAKSTYNLPWAEKEVLWKFDSYFGTTNFSIRIAYCHEEGKRKCPPGR